MLKMISIDRHSGAVSQARTVFLGCFALIALSLLLVPPTFAADTGVNGEIKPLDKEYFTTSVSNVRERPTKKSKRLKILNKCVRVRAVGQSENGNWLLFEKKNGEKLGFIASRLLEGIDESLLCNKKIVASPTKALFPSKEAADATIVSKGEPDLNLLAAKNNKIEIGYETERNVDIRIDFDGIIGVDSWLLGKFKDEFPKETFITGPRIPVSVIEANNSFSGNLSETATSLSDDNLIEGHDPRAKYHFRIFASRRGEPFQKPKIHMTALTDNGITVEPPLTARFNNINYREMLDWTRSAAFSRLEDAVYNDFPLPVFAKTIQLLDAKRQPLPNGYHIRVDIAYRPGKWAPTSTAITQDGKLAVKLPKKYISGRLVLGGTTAGTEPGTSLPLDIELIRFKPSQVASKNTARFMLPENKFSTHILSSEPLGFELEDIGPVRVSVIMNTSMGDHVVFEKKVDQMPEEYKLPPLLSGNYMVEIIPDSDEVLAGLEPIRGLKTPVPLFKEKRFRWLHNFFSTYVQDGVLTERGKENIEQSAKFLPYLLKLTSKQFDSSQRLPPKTRLLWKVIREYIFGNEKRPQMMRRLQRTFYRGGLVLADENITTKTFQIANALFDKIVFRTKRDREKHIFLKSQDNRSLYTSWLYSITNVPEKEKLISPEFAELLASR